VRRFHGIQKKLLKTEGNAFPTSDRSEQQSENQLRQRANWWLPAAVSGVLSRAFAFQFSVRIRPPIAVPFRQHKAEQ
jgi:hypothetical protein